MTREMMLFIAKKSKDNDVLIVANSNRAARRRKEEFKEFVLGALALPCREIKNSIFIFGEHRVVFCSPDALRSWDSDYTGLVYLDFPDIIHSQKRNRCPKPQLLIDAVMDDRAFSGGAK